MKQKTNTLPLRFESTRVLHTSFPREELLIRGLSIALALLGLAYVTFVSMSIVNVIARKEAMDEMVERRSIVAQLEHDFFALSETVTAARGEALGLSAVASVQYVHRPGVVGHATKANDRY